MSDEARKTAETAARQVLDAAAGAQGWMVCIWAGERFGPLQFMLRTTSDFKHYDVDLVLGQFHSAVGRMRRNLPTLRGDLFGAHEFVVPGIAGAIWLTPHSNGAMKHADVLAQAEKAMAAPRWMIAAWLQNDGKELGAMSVMYDVRPDELDAAVGNVAHQIDEIKKEPQGNGQAAMPADLPGPKTQYLRPRFSVPKFEDDNDAEAPMG